MRRTVRRDEQQALQHHQRLVPPAVQALSVQQAIQSPKNARPTQMLHLQRAAGNAAVVYAVQRAGGTGGTGTATRRRKVEANPEDAAFFGQENLAGGLGLGAGMENVVDFRNADYSPGAAAVGVGGTGIALGGVGTGVGIGLDSYKVHRLRKKLAKATDPLEKAAIIRELKMAGVDLGQKVANVGGHAADTAAAVLGSASAAAGAAAGGVAAPLQAFNVGRDIRKAVKQGERVKQLKELAQDWENPSGALKAQRETLAAAQAAHAEAQKAWLKAYRAAHGSGAKSPDSQPEVKQAAALLKTAADELADAQKSAQKLEDDRKEMEAAVKKQGQNGEPTLELIRGYALKKSKRGIGKKIAGIVGGTLGVAGSISFAVAAGAGSAVLMATPVGWALAATAAAIGIGVGVYKLVKWIKKKRSGTPGKRQTYAKRLFELGAQSDRQGKEARRLILSLSNKASLGIKAPDKEGQLDELRGLLVNAKAQPSAAKSMVKYIASKLAS